MACRRRVAGAIISLGNLKDLQLARVLYETFVLSLLMYGSETTLWKENGRSRIRALQMENLRSLLGIRRMDKTQNSRIRELCGVTKGVNERIDDGILWLFTHMEQM